MKKTVLFETIDGHDVIIGFDRPTVDPHETTEIVNALIKETPEYQAAEAKKAEYTQAVKDRAAAIKAKDTATYNNAVAAMNVRQDEQKPLARALANKITALRRSEAVYFTPRSGEVIKTSEEIETLLTAFKGRTQGVLITIDGGQIKDNRGKVVYQNNDYWFKLDFKLLWKDAPGTSNFKKY